MQTLFIMQGPSGGGKSTVAKALRAGLMTDSARPVTWICSTDDYFIEWDCSDDHASSTYKFDPKKLPEAHRWNLNRVKDYLARGCSVIVDNTNTQCWEAKPYVKEAVGWGIPVVFIRCDGKFKNVHGVPDEVVQKMRDRMEHLTVEGCLNAVAPWEKPKAAAV